MRSPQTADEPSKRNAFEPDFKVSAFDVMPAGDTGLRRVRAHTGGFAATIAFSSVRAPRRIVGFVCGFGFTS